MKDYDEVTGELEEQWNWRINELVKLENTYNSADDSSKLIIRKTQILLLYSHLEGYVKFAFLYYILTINDDNMQIKQLNHHLRTVAMHNIFQEYSNINRKGKYFTKDFPEDNKLKIYSRRLDFMESFHNFLDEVAKIPEDVIDTESNLKPEVLNKILFQLGFSLDICNQYRGDIQRLLNYRNSIAHGSQTSDISQFPYEKIEKSVELIVEAVRELIRDSLLESRYLLNVSK